MCNTLENFAKLLSQDGDMGDCDGEEFDLIYRGSSEIDRHYTKPMLPWIISEIKNQHRMMQVSVYIKNGAFKVRHKESKEVLLNHWVKQIHKCVMEQADHRCFLYTLRPPDKDSVSSSDVNIESTPQPMNLTLNHNYHCYLYQALTEQEVRSFFSCLRQQPREARISDSDSLNSLQDLSVHTESLFFEVLFVGRVKVSHSKVPATFIDEALTAFKQKEKRRQRNRSGENKQPSSPSRLMSFQHEGSGYSVPNIVFRNLGGEASKYGKMDHAILNKGNISREPGNVMERASKGAVNNSNESHGSLSSNSPSGPPLLIEPLQEGRMMSPSTGDAGRRGSDIPPHPGEHVMRSRSGSTGAVLPRTKYTRPSESDLKALGYDFNRTMLFHIGHREIQLINPELKSVQLHKPFKDIASCCQGVQARDHFGFICRELSGDTMVYVGYVFRCDQEYVTEEIMQVLNRSFSAMHEEHERERKEHLMCDFCPLKWFSQLCAEVEGLPAQKAHYVIIKRVSLLPEEEREIIIAKYEGAETSELPQKNNVLMMLLRTHFENKQMNHSHPTADDSSQKSEFLLGTNIESSLKRARQSITTSFNQLLKKRESDNNSEKENQRPTEILSRLSPTRSVVPDSPIQVQNTKILPLSEGDLSKHSCVLEGVSDSPLKPYRQRASTISGMGGDSMRKELMAAKKEKALPPSIELENVKIKPDEPVASTGPKTNIFLKFGSPSPSEDSSYAKEIEDELKPIVSYRQSILKKVTSPAKGVPETRVRKISTGVLGKQDRGLITPLPRRSTQELMILWKKAIFQHMILIRLERENQRLRALQKEAALQRVRLNYEEVELPTDAQQTWELLLSRPQARIDYSIIYAGIKQGIPKFVRGDVWNLLMIQHQLYGKSSRVKTGAPVFESPYEDLIKELTSHQHAILIDLGRTFPTHPYFTQTLGPGQLALFNILKAYSILDPEVGYCQGLSFVVGVLLLHIEEELTFHILKHLMFERGCRKHYRLELDGLQVRMYQLSRLVHDKLHNLYEHLEEHEVTPQLYSAPWFLTLFASQFPLYFVVRVFDLLFVNGMSAVFCVALVLLQEHEENLLALDSFEQIMDYFKTVVPDISTGQLTSFFDEVCECDFQSELSAYEVEYNVLKEELFFSPQQDANLAKLKEANKSLKRQNLDLLEELHTAKITQKGLESSNQSLHQSQHHLEVRVRWLEMERNNMRLLIQTLCRNASKETLGAVPATLERYLPNKASSPVPDDRYSRKHSSTDRLSTIPRRSSSQNPVLLSGKDTLTVPLQMSWSQVKSNSDTNTDKLVVPDITPVRERSTTLDPKAMQKYLKGATENQ